MTIYMFANKLLTDLWAFQLENEEEGKKILKILRESCLDENVKKADIISFPNVASGLGDLTEKGDLWVVQAALPVAFDDEDLRYIAKKVAPCIIGSVYLVDRLRLKENPNHYSPIILTSMPREKEVYHLESVFSPYTNITHFDELETVGIIPTIKQVLRL